MNYLTTYYKNLSEQLQTRVNNLKQRLYEANDRPFNNPGFSPGGLNDPHFTPLGAPVGMPGTGQGTKPPPNNVPGNVAPWNVFPPPPNGTVYWYYGHQYRYNGGMWDLHYPGPDGGTWLPHYWGSPGLG